MPDNFEREVEHLWQEYERLRIKMDDLRYATPNADAGPQAEALAEVIREVANKIEVKTDRLRRADPEFCTLRTAVPVDIDFARSILGEEEAVLSYFVTERGVAVMCTTSNEAYAKFIECDGLDSLTAEVAVVMSQPRPRGPMGASKRLHGLLDRAFAMLVAPMRAAFDGHRKLTIIPHGPLHRLPFAALWDSDNSAHFGNCFDLAMANSISTYWLSRTQLEGKKASDKIAVLAATEVPGMPPLPHGRAEADVIADLMRAGIVTDATRETLRECADVAGTIHLACHAEFESNAPLASALRLMPSHTDNGVLRAAELRQWRFPAARLVVMAACQSGRGDLTYGDEAMGLARAFLEARVPVLVASLWRVDDQSTRELMVSFYGGLQKGQSPAGALRIAQAHLRGHGYLAPYYWAPFAVIGAGHEPTIVSKTCAGDV